MPENGLLGVLAIRSHNFIYHADSYLLLQPSCLVVRVQTVCTAVSHTCHHHVRKLPLWKPDKKFLRAQDDVSFVCKEVIAVGTVIME